jgi:hypothetical protein
MTREADAPHNVDAQINAGTMIPDLLSRYPQVRSVFDRYGLNGCGGRLGPVEPIGFFARTHGIDEHRLLAELNEAASRTGSAQPDPSPSEAGVADAIYRRFFMAGIAVVLTVGRPGAHGCSGESASIRHSRRFRCFR